MYRHYFWIFLLLGVLFNFSICFAYPMETAESPIGYWKTMDDVTGKPKSIVQIWKTDDNILMGKVIKVFSKENQDQFCRHCKGDQYDQPIVGMVILSGLKAHEAKWSSGKILDLENGKMYRCAMQTLDNGKRLQVQQGYGLPMLGHSQIWERIDLMSG